MSDRKQALLDDVRAAHSEFLGVISKLTPEQCEAPVNEGWSVKDMLAHLSSIEARLRSMWQHALDGREWPAADKSVDAYNARCVEERRSWPVERIVDEFKRSGAESLAFIDRLGPEELDRTFNHPVRGVVTIESLVQIIPRHLREHGAQIKAAIGG
jgi:hypothetical protein